MSVLSVCVVCCAKSCPTLCDPMDCMLLCPWNFPGKNTGAGCYFLQERIFPTQGLNLCLWCLLNWQSFFTTSATWEACLHLFIMYLLPDFFQCIYVCMCVCLCVAIFIMWNPNIHKNTQTQLMSLPLPSTQLQQPTHGQSSFVFIHLLPLS